MVAAVSFVSSSVVDEKMEEREEQKRGMREWERKRERRGGIRWMRVKGIIKVCFFICTWMLMCDVCPCAV